MNIIHSLNWVDIIVGAILFRAFYVGIKQGFVIEAFKLIGIFFAIFITLHYFSGLAKFLSDTLHLAGGFTNFVSYIFLWSLVILIFKLVRDAFTLLFRIEAHSALDRWGGWVLACLRGLFIASLAVVLLQVTGIEYLQRITKSSFSGSRTAVLAPKMYEMTFSGLVSKFFPTEELNKEAFLNFDEAKKETKD